MLFLPLSFLPQWPGCPSSLPLLFWSNLFYLIVRLFLTGLDVCNYSLHQSPLHAVAPTGLFRATCRFSSFLSSSPYPVGEKTQSATTLETLQCTLIFWNTHYSLSNLNFLHCIIFLHQYVWSLRLKSIYALCPTCQFAPILLDHSSCHLLWNLSGLC